MHHVTLLPSKKQFVVGKMLCLGQNYADHAREMGSAPPSEPVIFLKPSSAIITDGEPILLPPMSSNVHHEVELTLLIGRTGRDIPREKALDYVAGYGIGLDMTMRDKQGEAKKAGAPWSVAKGFDTSAPLSAFVPRDQIPDPHNLEIRLSVNGTERQHASTSRMIFRIEEIIAYASTIFTLEEGDVIFTGTPEGVGQVKAGDVIDASISGVGTLHHPVGSRRGRE